MTTVAALRARSSVRVCYLLAIEGVRTLWATDREIVGQGVSAWIGTGYGDREVLGGLTVPDSLVFSLADEMPADGGAEFGLLDYDGSVSALFGNANPADLAIVEGRLDPATSPAPATLVGFGDNVTIRDRQVGAEAIGPSGERRYFPCIPGIDLPGPDHAALSDDLTGYLAPVVVTADPHILEGRRVALYRLHRDDDGTWPDWTDQYDGGALIWWGTLRNLGSVDAGRNWRVKCDGPSSWLRKALNRNAPTEWLVATPVFALRKTADQREDLMAVWLRKLTNGGVEQANAADLFDAANAISGTTESTVRVEINTVIQSIKSAGGAVNDYTVNFPVGDVYYTSSGIIRISIETSGSGYAGELFLALHHKVWRLLGWDPVTQKVIDGGQESEFDVAFTALKDGEMVTADGATAPTPGPDYWLGRFSTRKLGSTPGSASIAEQCNEGNFRYHRATTPGGVHVLDHLAGQQVRLGWDPVYLEGQLGRPPSSATINGSAATDTRWMLFKAPYRESREADVTELYQVAKVSYRTSAGVLTQDAEGSYAFEVDRWEDPRHFGIPVPPLSRPWATAAAGPVDGLLRCIPLAALRYSPIDTFDFVHHVLLRLLLSTGTATIAGTEGDDDPPTLTAGDNDHPDAGGVHHLATDAEIADLGLAIPADLVDWKSFRGAVDKLPGGWSGPLARCLVAWHGQTQAEDLIRSMLAGRGLALGLAGKRYSLHPQWSDLDLADASVSIGASDLHGKGGGGTRPGIQIRAVSPVDAWRVEHSYDVSTGEALTQELRARDPGAPARQGRVERTVAARGLVSAALYAFGNLVPPKPPPSWSADLSTTIAEGASRFLARPHQIVSLPISRVKGQDLMPGDVVALTSTWPPDLEGGYGLTGHPARVVRAVHYLGGERAGSVDVDLLVQGSTTDYLRRWAPIARLVDAATTVEQRYDSATRTFYCLADAFGVDDDAHVSDVTWFGEPAWTGLGGDALVYGYQYDGVTWSQGFSFVVSSVNTATHTITHTVAGITGTFYERMYTYLVLAPYDSQSAAWPRALFSVVTQANGKFGGGATKGWQLGA